MDVPAFITRWHSSAAAERANYQLFLSELCDFLEVPRPDPTVADDSKNAYVFERAVHFQNGDGSATPGRIDLYKRGSFVLEAKQGSNKDQGQGSLFAPPARLRRGTAVRETGGWDEAMLAARNQAEGYAKALPVSEGWPPFLIVVDVGYSIEVYADFSLTGKNYSQFPDKSTYRVSHHDLIRPDIRERLRSIWLDPLALDPSRISARVTRDVAGRLAELARSLELDYEPQRVASFLTRCIFTSFAEDVRLLPLQKWTNLLESFRSDLPSFKPVVESLWRTMNEGGFSPIFREHVLRFNGGLFESVEALQVSAEQLEMLILAARCDWKDVEPAIFGTLLERALNKSERHKLGAHYTPRAYVERLVLPTVIEPLRDDWKTVQAAAYALYKAGDENGAQDEVLAFQRRLCQLNVLDPACGSGNFLYVTLEHLKRLEGEVLDLLESLGHTQTVLAETGMSIDPHQLLGIEINPRAAVITDLVLWIGYLQWYFRTWGALASPPEPVIKRFHNIECRDAILAYDHAEPVREANGEIKTQWDQHTMRPNPVTGEEVPDDTARRPILRYENPRRAEWPKADFIIGNPPFIGNWMIRRELGEGYAETLRSVYDDVPESADFVMYWWHRAASLARSGEVRRFGFIATNSLRQTYNRRVVAHHLGGEPPLSLVFGIPDHPWVDTQEGAAVRISMTVGQGGKHEGRLLRVVSERPEADETAVELSERAGVIHADLTIGPDVSATVSLRANDGLSCPGVKLHGAGFIVTPREAAELGLGRIPGLEQHIRLYRNGRDLTATPRNVMVIDLFGLEADEVRDRFPEVYQWVWDRVKPERDAKVGASKDMAAYADKWWLFGKTRSSFRPALAGLSRYIATVETSKHRFFVFLDQSILPDNKLVTIALEDAHFLGVLSSRVHVAWALAGGSWLGVGNDPVYVKTRCFEPFPFPEATETQRDRIRDLGKSLDAHRKRQQALHPGLTITHMYNVLEKLRSGAELDSSEREVHEQGLVSVLRQIHDELDAAVLDAYGWPAGLSTEDILYRLVALNAERQAEERNGLVRWLRPEFQSAGTAGQAGLGIEMEEEPAAERKIERRAWPSTLSEKVGAIRGVLASHRRPIDPAVVSRHFTRARSQEIREILETLVSLGQARQVEGRFVA